MGSSWRAPRKGDSVTNEARGDGPFDRKLMAMSPVEEIGIGQMAIRFRLEGQESGGSVAVFEFDVPAAGRVPVAHSHDAFDETIYGLEGVLSWTIEGTKTDVSPGILGPGYFRDMASLLGASKDGPRPRSVRRSDAMPRPHPRTIVCTNGQLNLPVEWRRGHEDVE